VGELYLDGQLIAKNDTWLRPTSVIVDVTPGTHYLAASIRNDPLPQGFFPPPETQPYNHVVVPGDTLWDLARRFYGSGSQWRAIYNANQAIIQSTAQARGLWWPWDPGHWIFPGTVLRIPGLSVTVGTPLRNPTAMLLAGFRAANGTVAGNTPIVISDDSWSIVEYPPSPPGMTVGRVMRVLIDEAQRRGALPGLRINFNDTVDSAGRQWPMVSDISTKVGTD